MLVQRDIEVTTAPVAVSPKASPTLERRRQWERQCRRYLRASDHLVIVLAVLCGAVLQTIVATVSVQTMVPAFVLVVLWSFFLAGMRSRESRCLGAGAVEYQRVAHSTGLALGAVAVWTLIAGWAGDRVLLFSAIPLGLLGLMLSRWGWRRWLRKQRRLGQFCSRTLVVGEQRDVDYVTAALGAEDNGFHVVGATLTDTHKYSGDGAPSDGVLQRSAIERVRATAAAINADTIVIATIPNGSSGFIRELSWHLEGTAANLLLSNQVTDVVGPRISFRPVDGLPMVQIRIPSYEGGHYFLKRGLDITVSMAALVLITLLSPFIALAIKLDSAGSVFFAQDRIGRDGQLFKMFKFRSMRQDAELRLQELRAQNEGAGVLFKLRHDPRVTRVGAVLRRLSIDELPQFWNVLRGEMSVVGPRPPLPKEVMAYDGEVVRRLYVKPGITGPWQVGGRSNLTWEESVRLDLSYVENWSVINDLQIIWRTARVVAHREGAY